MVLNTAFVVFDPFTYMSQSQSWQLRGVGGGRGKWDKFVKVGVCQNMIISDERLNHLIVSQSETASLVILKNHPSKLEAN